MACSVRIWGFSPAEMERSSGFRMGFFPDEWGVVVVKDLEKMGIVGNRKNCRVGVVVVVLSSILRVLSFFSPAGYDERRTTSACLLVCLLINSSQEAEF